MHTLVIILILNKMEIIQVSKILEIFLSYSVANAFMPKVHAWCINSESFFVDVHIGASEGKPMEGPFALFFAPLENSWQLRYNQAESSCNKVQKVKFNS